jgi:hypothetical protein
VKMKPLHQTIKVLPELQLPQMAPVCRVRELQAGRALGTLKFGIVNTVPLLSFRGQAEIVVTRGSNHYLLEHSSSDASHPEPIFAGAS